MANFLEGEVDLNDNTNCEHFWNGFPFIQFKCRRKYKMTEFLQKKCTFI